MTRNRRYPSVGGYHYRILSILKGLINFTEDFNAFYKNRLKRTGANFLLSVSAKSRHENISAVAEESFDILKSLPSLLSQCGEGETCINASPCELVAKYKINSKKLLLAAQNMAKVMRSSRALKDSAKLLSDKAIALEKENSRRLATLPEIQVLCGAN